MVLEPFTAYIQEVQDIPNLNCTGKTRVLLLITVDGQVLPVKVSPRNYSNVEQLQPNDKVTVTLYLNTRPSKTSVKKPFYNTYLQLKYIYKE